MMHGVQLWHTLHLIRLQRSSKYWTWSSLLIVSLALTVEGSTIMPMGSSTYQYGGDDSCVDPDGGVIQAVKNLDTSNTLSSGLMSSSALWLSTAQRQRYMGYQYLCLSCCLVKYSMDIFGFQQWHIRHWIDLLLASDAPSTRSWGLYLNMRPSWYSIYTGSHIWSSSSTYKCEWMDSDALLRGSVFEILDSINNSRIRDDLSVSMSDILRIACICTCIVDIRTSLSSAPSGISSEGYSLLQRSSSLGWSYCEPPQEFEYSEGSTLSWGASSSCGASSSWSSLIKCWAFNRGWFPCLW